MGTRTSRGSIGPLLLTLLLARVAGMSSAAAHVASHCLVMKMSLSIFPSQAWSEVAELQQRISRSRLHQVGEAKCACCEIVGAEMYLCTLIQQAKLAGCGSAAVFGQECGNFHSQVCPYFRLGAEAHPVVVAGTRLITSCPPTIPDFRAPSLRIHRRAFSQRPATWWSMISLQQALPARYSLHGGASLAERSSCSLTG